MFTQMIDIKTAAQELNNMLNEAIVKAGIFVPINKTTLQYKGYLIQQQDDGSWNVTYKKSLLANTFLKVSALTLCKLHEKKNYKKFDEVVYNDKLFEVNYTDSRYFKRAVKLATDNVRKDSALWRYEIVSHKAKAAKQRIDGIFYQMIG